VHTAAVILILVAAVIARRTRGAACASTFALLGTIPELMESEAFHSADAGQLCLQVPEHRP
jgi:hypothetical protein